MLGNVTTGTASPRLVARLAYAMRARALVALSLLVAAAVWTLLLSTWSHVSSSGDGVDVAETLTASAPYQRQPAQPYLHHLHNSTLPSSRCSALPVIARNASHAQLYGVFEVQLAAVGGLPPQACVHTATHTSVTFASPDGRHTVVDAFYRGPNSNDAGDETVHIFVARAYLRVAGTWSWHRCVDVEAMHAANGCVMALH